MRRINYGTVGIVGLGLIGGSVGLRLREVGAAKRVIGFDMSDEARSDAERLGYVDRTYETLNRLGDADILVLAVPPNQIVPCLVEADVFCKVNCIVTDTSSVKTQVVQWVGTYPLRFGPRFVGGHPVVSSDKESMGEATASLFEEAAWVLTPTEKTDRGALDAVKSLVTTLGAKPVILSPEEHDRHAAILLHLPHVLAGALTQLATNLVHPEILGRSWGDLTSPAGSNPELWANILTNNKDEVVSAIEDLQYHLQQVKSAVSGEQYEALLEFFETSRRAKAGWQP